MMTLSELQIIKIKDHMLHEEDALKRRWKTKKNQFDTQQVPHSEVDALVNEGWFVNDKLKTKTKLSRPKETSRQFEDDIWCMFYELGFRIINSDDKLRVPWDNNPVDDKQLDIVAVGDDAIFVVECKAAEKSKKQSFQKDLLEIGQYKDGIAESLKQVYGKNKRVKFIFATRNYRIEEEGEDAQRMRKYDIYHLDENGYNYIKNLIKSYKSSVIYQFYGIMFKNELISDKKITIPALMGKMGGKKYFLFSIEPSTLLKIGYVLHRTKVNDSMAPTYQRLLVPKRLNGITKFIDSGGYFPNSIILNFDEPNENIKITFDSIDKEEGSDSEFGLLNIPNAYGIAYIIDGQHRVYGYSNSKFKDKHTIPVVAFLNMPSEEQLRIFMDINENQKAVSKNLKIDLEEDLYWTATRLDSRMKALRSSTIKELCAQSNSILYNKISIGEDQSILSSVFFEKALLHSGLIPKAKQTRWVEDTETCLYDINETNIDKAMNESKKRIFNFLNGCYELADTMMDDETKSTYLFSNRATYPFITLCGLLHTYLFKCDEIKPTMSIGERIAVIKPYIETLCKGLNDIAEEEDSYLKSIQGQGAEKKWLLAYQAIIHKTYTDYYPEELKEYEEMRDENIQKEGNELRDKILVLLKELIFKKLEEVYGNGYVNNILQIKADCTIRMVNANPDNEGGIEEEDWMDWMEIVDYKSIIEKNFSYDVFADAFGIPLSNGAKSKKDKLSWLSLLEQPKGKKKVGLKRTDINRLWLIHDHLVKFMQNV